MKRLLAPAFASLLLLGACGNKPEAPKPPANQKTVAAPAAPAAEPAQDAQAEVTGFKHDPKVDVSGYYFTETAAQSGNWKLTSLSLGRPSDFADWEAGKRPETFGPIILDFEDVTSPTAENELGQTYHTVSFRMMPAAYRVDGAELVFRGEDARLGTVVFQFTPDLEALKAAKALGPNGGPVRTILRGSLRIGDERIRNISFFYHPGE